MFKLIKKIFQVCVDLLTPLEDMSISLMASTRQMREEVIHEAITASTSLSTTQEERTKFVDSLRA